jgi:hypothetical protein
MGEGDLLMSRSERGRAHVVRQVIEQGQREASERLGIGVRQLKRLVLLAVTAYGTYPLPDPTEDEKTIDARVDAIIASQRTVTRGSPLRT